MSVTTNDSVEEPVIGGNALKSRIAFRVLRTFGMFVSRVFFRATYEGMEHLPPTGAYLISPSHRSNLDSFVIPGITKRKIRYLGKDSIWKFKPLGWLLTTGGAISVVRGTPDREAMRMCVRALQAGDPLVVYPEGRRKSGPVVEELFDGVAFMATKAGVPIVPVGIGGSEAAMGANHKIPRPKHIHVIVGPPIYPTTDGTGKAGRSEIRSITATLQSEIQRLFDEAQRKA